MLNHIIEIVDKLTRGLIYLGLIICGAAMAVLAAAVVAVGCWRVWQWTWTNLLGFPWGGQ